MKPAGRTMLLSAGLACPDASEPGYAGRVAALADAMPLDMLVLGDIAAPVPFDPLVLAGWLAPRLCGVGLVALVDTARAAPFHIARALSALDFLTEGCCGWQPAGSGASERNLDFIAATASLWDSWDADALIIDQASGIYLDPARVHRGDYRGTHFRVLGPLNAARPPQGHPILVQSDADPGWALAERWTDVLLVQVPEIAALITRCQALRASRRNPSLRVLAALPPSQLSYDGVLVCETAFRSGWLDGIHVLADDTEDALRRFADTLLPGLRDRGLTAAARPAGSLRMRMDLQCPGGRHHGS